MAILIGHASIDENGTVSGGIAGDQTTKEVCIRTWYSKPWEFVLRCRDSEKAEKMASACEKGCANNKIGYDQRQRNTLYAQAKSVDYDLSKITTACECDCSSFMTVCALAADIKIIYGSNAPTTATMKNIFNATGEFDILTDSKYLSSDLYLKRGDILVKAGSHTAMALENGSSVISSVEAIPKQRKGIDVSSYQGNIDWKSVKNDGVQFAILKIIRKDLSADKMFEQNYRECLKNEIDLGGCYNYSYAATVEKAKTDAKRVLEILNGRNLKVWLDVEDKCQQGLGRLLIDIIQAYQNVIVSNGYEFGIYTYLSFYNSYIKPYKSQINCDFWIARYPSSSQMTVPQNPSSDKKPDIEHVLYGWQYTSKGIVSGIKGNVDLNIEYISQTIM